MNSRFSCKSIEYCGFVLESFAQLMLSWLCITRIAALGFPHSSASVTSVKASVVAIAVAAVVSAICTTPMLVAYDLSDEKEQSDARFQCSSQRQMSKGIIWPLVTGSTYFILKDVLLLILNLILSWLLVRIQRKRSNIGAAAMPKHVNHKEIRIAVALVACAALHLTFKLFLTAAWLILDADMVTGFLGNLQHTVIDVGSYTESLWVTVRLWNFFVYLLIIPSFKASIVNWMHCGRHAVHVSNESTQS